MFEESAVNTSFMFPGEHRSPMALCDEFECFIVFIMLAASDGVIFFNIKLLGSLIKVRLMAFCGAIVRGIGLFFESLIMFPV